MPDPEDSPFDHDTDTFTVDSWDKLGETIDDWRKTHPGWKPITCVATYFEKRKCLVVSIEFEYDDVYDYHR